jgi:quercetin dioxygenase-like cupin family protein
MKGKELYMIRILFAAAGLLADGAALAADSGVVRKVFDRTDVPPGYEAVVGSAAIPAGASIGRHVHHGVEFGYIAKGEVEFTVDGQAPFRLKAGGFYRIDAGKVHDARAVGGPATAVATWVVEKGKPLAEPAK